MKQIFLFLASTFITIGSYAASPIDLRIDGITYRINPVTSEATLLNSYSEIYEAIIPNTITYEDEVYPVTSIADNAFAANVFSYRRELTRVEIPNSVTSIGSEAFYMCSNLTNIKIPNSVTSIGSGAFMNSGLTNIELPNSLTSIKNELFSGCYNLTSVEIPNSVTSIGKEAFYRCNRLTSVKIPNSVTSMGRDVFYECESLENVEISNSLTLINNDVFFRCKRLTSVKIPDSVRSIYAGAFYECSGLESIEIPKSVSGIGEEAFYSCSKLKKVEINDLEAWCNITFFYSANANPLWNGSGDLYLNGEKIVDLVIPESITTLPFATFVHCSSIETVRFPEGFTSMTGGRQFQSCTNLKEIYLPSSTTDILGYYTFAYCKSLETVYCYAMIPPTSKHLYAFDSSYPEYMTLHVPEGTKQQYASADVWKDFGTIIDDLPTNAGIEDNIIDTADGPLVVYNLQGVRFNISSKQELDKLPTGIYIINGKKHYIK